MFRFSFLSLIAAIMLLTGCSLDPFKAQAPQGRPLPIDSSSSMQTPDAIFTTALHLIEDRPHLVAEIGIRGPSELTAVEITYVIVDRPEPGFFRKIPPLGAAEQTQLLDTQGIRQRFPVPDLRNAAVVDKEDLAEFPSENFLSFAIPIPDEPGTQQILYRVWLDGIWSSPQLGSSFTLHADGTASAN